MEKSWSSPKIFALPSVSFLSHDIAFWFRICAVIGIWDHIRPFLPIMPKINDKCLVTWSLTTLCFAKHFLTHTAWNCLFKKFCTFPFIDKIFFFQEYLEFMLTRLLLCRCTIRNQWGVWFLCIISIHHDHVWSPAQQLRRRGGGGTEDVSISLNVILCSLTLFFSYWYGKDSFQHFETELVRTSLEF